MRAVLTMLAVAAIAAGCGGGDSAPSAPAESRDVLELESLHPVAERFDADRGRTRLLLIFSPT